MNFKETSGAVPFKNSNSNESSIVVDSTASADEPTSSADELTASAATEVTELFRDFQTKIDIYSPFLLDEIDGSDCSRPNSPTAIFSTLLIDGQRELETEIIVIGSLLDKLPNLAGFARTSEIFGVKTLYVPDLAALASTDFLNVAMTAEKWLDIRQLTTKEIPQFLETIKRDQGTLCV